MKYRDSWFQTDTTGLLGAQGNIRNPRLVFELLSNSFDEEGVTKVILSFNLSKSTNKGSSKGVIVAVEDNGPGFANIKDAYTLFRPTQKRAKPGTRGRFDFGDKLAIFHASEARIETVGHTVTFSKQGRKDSRNTREKGTLVRITFPWTAKTVREILDEVRLIIPPTGVDLTVHPLEGEIFSILRPRILAQTQADLQTVVAKDGRTLVETRRKTSVVIYESPDNRGWLMEMGIPIQPIDCPYSVSVEQKVPLPLSRDVVKPSYLQEIYAIVLNTMHLLISEEEFSEGWITTAVMSRKLTNQAKKSVTEKKFNNTVLRSSDSWANEEARNHGMEVIDSRLVSKMEREELEKFGLVTSSRIFKRQPIPVLAIPPSDWTGGMQATAELARLFARDHTGIDNLVVEFHRLTEGSYIAQFAKDRNRLEWNLANCEGGESFFDKPISPKVIEIILHELAHAVGNGHDSSYHREFERLSADVIVGVATSPEEFLQITGRKR